MEYGVWISAPTSYFLLPTPYSSLSKPSRNVIFRPLVVRVGENLLRAPKLDEDARAAFVGVEKGGVV